MNRLTKRNRDIAFIFGNTAEAIERLAAYEDTGLDLGEIVKLKAERDAAVRDIVEAMEADLSMCVLTHQCWFCAFYNTADCPLEKDGECAPKWRGPQQRIMITAARKCPQCGGDSRVYGTRETQSGQIRRNRKCVNCGFKFITLETYQYKSSGIVETVKHAHWIVKRDNSGRIVNFWCSSCGPDRINFVMDSYCPHCGAKMDSRVEYV